MTAGDALVQPKASSESACWPGDGSAYEAPLLAGTRKVPFRWNTNTEKPRIGTRRFRSTPRHKIPKEAAWQIDLAKAEEELPDVSAAFDRRVAADLDSRAEIQRVFELRRALEWQSGGAAAPTAAAPVPNATQRERKRFADCSPKEFYLGSASPISLNTGIEEWKSMPRPPLGSGYATLPTCERRQYATLGDRFGVPALPRDSLSPSAARRARIEELERGMQVHEADRLIGLAEGTHPLLDSAREVILPVPPEEERISKFTLAQRLRSTSHNPSAKQAMKRALIASVVIGREVGDRPLAATEPMARAKGESLTDPPRSVVRTRQKGQETNLHLEQSALKTSSVHELLLEAEGLLLQEVVDEEVWMRIAVHFTGQAYEAEPRDVVRMVRALGATAARVPKASRCQLELARSADHLVQSLTGRLQDAGIDFLASVLEAMRDATCGSQVFLDMLVALIFACHHRDCRALSPSVSCRLASVLGQLASGPLRLRPQGVGGPSTATNRRVMEVLQRRIVEQLQGCRAEDLARLDSYYIARLCGDAEKRAILVEMAALDLGFSPATQHTLPLLVQLQEVIQREVPDSFRWSLPRQTREYLERLKVEGLRDSAPWRLPADAVSRRIMTWEDIFGPKRSKTQQLRK